MSENQKLPELLEDLNIISQLGDYPATDDGLSTEEFKSKFDTAGIILKNHLNKVIGILNGLLVGAGNFLSGGTMTGPINMNGQTLSGLNEPVNDTEAATKSYADEVKTAALNYTDTKVNDAKTAATTEAQTYTDTKVKNAAPKNLLDNSNFAKPVNQRGSSSYTGNKYTIDRWCSISGYGVVTVNSGYVNMKSSNGSGAYFDQYIESGKIKGGRTYTLVCRLTNGSVWVKSGIASTDMGSSVIKYMKIDDVDVGSVRFTYDAGAAVYKIMFATSSTTGMDIMNVALYEGEYTEETIPSYQPKEYSAELLECQRYFLSITVGYDPIGAGYGNETTLAWVFIPLPVKMRVTPSISYSNSKSISNLFVVGGGKGVAATNISLSQRNNVLKARVTASGLTINEAYALRADSNFSLLLSADL